METRGTERTTQPILCCLGKSVAGCPTQFVMERAFAALELDWIAMTVEVDSADFAAAAAGIHAMQFQAARFFPPYQHDAMEYFRPSEATRQLIGSVTSAIHGHDGWESWHHLGPGMLLEIARHVAWDQSICWLCDDSIRSRSMLVAAIENPPAELLVSHAGLAEELRNILPKLNKALHWNEVSQPQVVDHLKTRSAHQLLELSLVGQGLPSEVIDSGQWHELTQQTSTLVSAVDDAALGELAQLHSPTVRVSELDQNVGCELVDFQRWTGEVIPLSVVRDALDEYSGF